jgi:hypothetical protein
MSQITIPVSEVLEVLNRYGRHTYECSRVNFGDGVCDCGLLAIVERLQMLEHPISENPLRQLNRPAHKGYVGIVIIASNRQIGE